MLALIREMSIRHLLRAPLRSLLIVVGIALGVAVFVAAQATAASLLTSFEDLINRVGGRADLVVVGNQSGIDSGLVAKIAEVDGVEHAAASLEATTTITDDGRPLLVLGVDFLGDTFFLPFTPEPGEKDVVEDPLAFANDPTAILVSSKLAKRRGLTRDSPLSLLTAEGVKTFHVRGILDDSGPAASFGGQVAVMFLDAAQVSFGRGMLVDRIEVALRKGEDTAKMARRISSAIGKVARVEKPQQAGERLRALTQPLRSGLQLSGLVALLVGMFIIYNAIGISVAQRRKEVGLLRALGVVRRNVVFHFCVEAMLLSLPGVALGLMLAKRLLVITQTQTLEVINQGIVGAPVQPEISTSHAVQGIIAGVFISVVAAYIPARRGANMDPISALRPSAIHLSASAIPYQMLGVIGCLLVAISWLPAYVRFPGGGFVATLLNVCGAALVAPSVVMLLRVGLVGLSEVVFGISGRLGLDYVERNLGRSSINVLALMVAVSMSISVSGWLTSFESSIRAWFDQTSANDLTITAGSPFLDQRHVPFNPNVLDKIKGIEGIQGVVASRIIQQQIDNHQIELSAYDTVMAYDLTKRTNKSWQFVDGRLPFGREEMRQRQLIVLGENAARRLKVKAGDRVTLHTPSGPLNFEVRAIIVDYSSEEGAGFIDREVYEKAWKDGAIDFIEVFLKSGANASRAAEQLREKMGGGQGLFVTTTSELKNQFFTAVKRGFSYTRSLELIVLVIALLGVIGTMISAVIDRTREIGMLRAIGCTQQQVTVALVIEAAFLGLCAVIGGVLAGTLQCLLFLKVIAVDEMGWHLTFLFPTEGALRIGLLVIVTAALAGLLPGLRAAKLEIKEALVYE
jgi:putative ABC transport system permease protein